MHIRQTTLTHRTQKTRRKKEKIKHRENGKRQVNKENFDEWKS